MCAIGSSLKQWNEGHRHEIRPINIGHVRIGPVLISDIVIEVLLEFGSRITLRRGLARGDTGVVDEDIEVAVLCLDFLDKFVDVALLCYISLYGDDLA